MHSYMRNSCDFQKHSLFNVIISSPSSPFISSVDTISFQTDRWSWRVSPVTFLQWIKISSSSSSSFKKLHGLKKQTCTIFCALRNYSAWTSRISWSFVTSVVTVRWTVTNESFVDAGYSPWFTGKPASGTQLKIEELIKTNMFSYTIRFQIFCVMTIFNFFHTK